MTPKFSFCEYWYSQNSTNA